MKVKDWYYYCESVRILSRRFGKKLS